MQPFRPLLLSPQAKANMITLSLSGVSIGEIAQITKAEEKTVEFVLSDEAGFLSRKFRPIYFMLQGGNSLEKISSVMGVALSGLKRIFPDRDNLETELPARRSRMPRTISQTIARQERTALLSAYQDDLESGLQIPRRRRIDDQGNSIRVNQAQGATGLADLICSEVLPRVVSVQQPVAAQLLSNSPNLHIQSIRPVAVPSTAVVSPRPSTEILTDTLFEGKVFGTFQWQDGRKYTGEWLNGRKNGQGKMLWVSGDSYSGLWESDMFEGHGIHIVKYVREYEGSFSQGKRHGYGKNISYKGIFYEGEWANGKKDGEGQETKPNRYKKRGSFCENLMHGYGVMETSLCEYEGIFFKGKFHGQGTLKKQNGYVYNGSWANGKRNGYGVELNHLNERYTGEWKEDFKEGYGTNEYSNNDVYIGEWLADQHHGNGTIEWADGSRYEGEWVNGKIKGLGLYIWPDGTVYQGSLVDGLADGFGILNKTNGESYEGEWINDKMHGYGTFTWANGKTSSGCFNLGQLHGEAKEIEPDGRVYEGNWNFGEKHGSFVLKCYDQTVYQIWNQGELVQSYD